MQPAQVRAFHVDELPALEALAAESYPAGLDDCEEWKRAAGLLSNPPDGIQPLIAGSGTGLMAYGAVFTEPWMIAAKRCRLHLLMREIEAGRAVLDILLARITECGTASVEVRVASDAKLTASLLLGNGFSELRQDVFMELKLSEAAPPHFDSITSALQSGIRLISLEAALAQDPAAMSRLHQLWIELARDDPAHDPSGDPLLDAFDRWMRSPASLLPGCFLAIAGEHFAGVTLVRRMADDRHALSQNLTGVLSEYRRQGIATALKQAAASFARANGFESLQTSMAGSNEAILSLNTKLRYCTRLVLTVYEKRLNV